MRTKVCSRCDKRKSITAFPLRHDGGSKDGHNTQCRGCLTARVRAWAKKNPFGASPLARYRRRYAVQKGDAKRRGIPFLLSFDEWFTIWKMSGHLDESGSYRGQYHMARRGDKGPYQKGNVRICRAEENHAEKRHSAATRAKISAGNVSRWKTRKKKVAA